MLPLSLAPSRVSLVPGPINVKTGQNVKLPTCHVKGYPPPTVTWRKLAGVFPKNRVSSFNNSMTLRAATRNDTGAYECQATNRLGQASAVTTVIVWPPPKLTTKPVKSAVELPGRNLSLNCFVSDQNTISWRRIGGTWEDKRTKIQNGTLTIYNLKTSDSGSYICEAKSLFHHIEEKTVLQVKGEPSHSTTFLTPLRLGVLLRPLSPRS